MAPTLSVTFNWERDSEEVCNNIAKRNAKLRIILKVKDDVDYAREWVEHHAKIVGIQNLIVLDNESNNPLMHEFYKDIEGDAVVASFSGHPNRVHRVHEFLELYAAIRQSSEYFYFTDVDELLIWARADGTYASGPEILYEISQQPCVSVFPGIWLENIFGFRDRFRTNSICGNGLTHGKPIISSQVHVSGMLNHNCQLMPSFYSAAAPFHVVNLHLKNFSIERRVNGNLMQLQKAGVLMAADTADDAMKIDPETVRPGKSGDLTTRNYLIEIQKIWPQRLMKVDGNAALKQGQMLIGDDGKFVFYSDVERLSFLDIIKDTVSGTSKIYKN